MSVNKHISLGMSKSHYPQNITAKYNKLVVTGLFCWSTLKLMLQFNNKLIY